MDFKEAIHAALTGKKIRRHCWNPNDYWVFDGNILKGRGGDKIILTRSLLMGHNWEIFKESDPLSDKIELVHDRYSLTEFEAIDVNLIQEALRHYINWLKLRDHPVITNDVETKAKEIFGERLV